MILEIILYNILQRVISINSPKLTRKYDFGMSVIKDEFKLPGNDKRLGKN